MEMLEKQMNSPQYSIIIPIYNVAPYLQKCLDSICEQSFSNYEILLIDDGSTDDSSNICDKYAKKDNRIKVIHKSNGGVSSARNRGIEEAKGEWIAFIDADDAIMPEYFPKGAYESDLLVQNWNYSDKESDEYLHAETITHEMMPAFCKMYLDKHLFRTPWAKFFKREIIEKYNIRFDQRYRLGEDTLFVLDYLNHCHSIDVVASSFYLYTSSDDSKKYRLSIKESIQYLKTFLTKYRQCPYKCQNLLAFKYYYFRNRTINIDRLSTRIIWKISPTIIGIKRELGYSILS